MLFILNVINSPISDKRYRAIFNDQTFIDFGIPRGFDEGLRVRWAETYIDHHCEKRRLGYWKFVYNSNENELLYWLIPCDLVLTTYLLYGDSTDLLKNVQILNNAFKKNVII